MQSFNGLALSVPKGKRRVSSQIFQNGHGCGGPSFILSYLAPGLGYSDCGQEMVEGNLGDSRGGNEREKRYMAKKRGGVGVESFNWKRSEEVCLQVTFATVLEDSRSEGVSFIRFF